MNPSTRIFRAAAEAFAESLDFFPELADYNLGPDGYLELIRQAKTSVSIPVIASLNGVSPGGWVRYAREMEQAGADAIELNIYSLVTDPNSHRRGSGTRLLRVGPRGETKCEDSDRREAFAFFQRPGQFREAARHIRRERPRSVQPLLSARPGYRPAGSRAQPHASAIPANCCCGFTGPRSFTATSRRTSQSPAACTAPRTC